MSATFSFAESDISKGMKSEQRRLAAQKTFDRLRRAGLPTEEDPRFLVWIEQWIAGEIEMQEVRERYLGFLREQASELKRRALARGAKLPSDPGPQPIDEIDSFLSDFTKG
ncbi:hypothetical protein [Rhizobium leguminosarum]|uniref:hypothetical protein n=1 Tax=Rhizobium leguminosarum TaxID=384 RepID=UPI001FD9B135|nr:hypothetical protein [Rhizobium leguminosarum]